MGPAQLEADLNFCRAQGCHNCKISSNIIVQGIQFDQENDNFYTISNDRSLKVWNIREMMYIDSHYGHTSDILDLAYYSSDRLLSCGLDRQVIFWKINEDSELLYKNEAHSVDSVNIIN